MILEAALIATLAAECAPNVEPSTMQTLIVHESSGNPYAIGSDPPIAEQPKSKEEAILMAKSLIDMGVNVSLGLGQINHKNFNGLKMTVEDAFEYCPNIKAADKILSDCFARASNEGHKDQAALQAAFSCYYSNNFKRGFVKEEQYKNTSYVERVALTNEKLVPAINFNSGDVGQTLEKKEVKKKQKAVENLKKDSDNWDVFNDFKNQ